MRLRRLIDLPGIRYLENEMVLNNRSRVRDDAVFVAQCNGVTLNLFNVTVRQTSYRHPEGLSPQEYDLEEEIDRHEAYFVDPRSTDAAKILRFHNLGWDITDDLKRILQSFDYVSRQLEAAIHRLGDATLPDFDQIAANDWGARLAESVKRRTRDKP
jgi:hypothetical protein